MRRRNDPNERFLTRTPEEWREISGPYRSWEFLGTIPKLAGWLLARHGILRAGEVTRLRRIASAAETHPRLTADESADILATWGRHGPTGDSTTVTP